MQSCKQEPKRAPHNQNSQPSTCTRCGRTPPHDHQQETLSAPSVQSADTFKLSVVQQLKLEKSTRMTHANFLGMWTHGTLVSNLWRLSLLLNGVLIEFDVETGAEASVISETQHQKIGSSFLSPPGKTEKP